ncbi:hypothetical protein CR513_30224, partial [Mucuna pruriens]
MLEEGKGRWVKELPQVLRSYHTTSHSTTQETPFQLMFDIEAMILVEIGESSPRTALFQNTQNEEEMNTQPKHVQEEDMEKWSSPGNSRAKTWSSEKFVGILTSTSSPKISKDILESRKGAYKLEHLDKWKIPRTWNATNICFYYKTHKVAHIKEYAAKARAARRYEKVEVGKGAYKLQHLDRRKIPRTWNATNLCFYYS